MRMNKSIFQLCERTGHTMLKCFHRFDITFQGSSPTRNNASVNNTNDSPQALLTEANSSDDSNDYSTSFLDSAATHHMTNDSQNLSNKQDYKGKSKVLVGNGSSIPIANIGSNFIHYSSVHEPLILRDILHVPGLTRNLLSISLFTKQNNVILKFNSSCCLVKDQMTKQVLLQGTLHNGLYQLCVLPSRSSQSHSVHADQLHPVSSSTKLTNNCTPVALN